MRTWITAIFRLCLSVAVTVLMMVAVFPSHPLGGTTQVAASNIQPAVFIEGVHQRPGAAGNLPSFPFITDRIEGTRCPYLAALAAASRCPALTDRGRKSICPFLERRQLQPHGRENQKITHGTQHT